MALNAPSLNANRSENTAPISKPRAAEQNTQPNTKEKETEQRFLPLQQVDNSKSTQNESPNTHEQSAHAEHDKEDKTFIQRLLAFIFNPNWIQTIALIATICVMIWMAKKELRAYVFLHDVSIVGNPEWDNVHIVIRNSGKTPAYRLTCTAGISNQTAPPVPFDPRFITEQRELFPSRIDMAPGGTAASIFENRFSPEFREEMRTGRRVIYLSGVVHYRDAFSFFFNRDHRTEFRYIYRGIGNQWEACPEDNEAT